MDKHTLRTFQNQVADLLLRHRSFLDVSSKFQESNARVNRAAMKSVTDCGCISVEASRQKYTEQDSFIDLQSELKTHLTGKLCENCADIVKTEMGTNLFYLAAFCNLLEIPLDEVLQQELDNLSTLGMFHLR